MKRNHLHTFLLTIFVLISFNTNAFKYHDNQVKITNNSLFEIVSAEFIITAYSITPGQDRDKNIFIGLQKSFNGNGGSFTYKIGHKKSKTVANWFTQNISSTNNTFNKNPDDLNFALMGNLTLNITGGTIQDGVTNTVTLNNVVFAQGHSGFKMNWWFGGSTCRYQSGNTVKCSGTSSTGYPVSFMIYRGTKVDVNRVVIENIEFREYEPFYLQSHYVGENVGCTWQSADKYLNCPPYVIYYNKTQRSTMQLVVHNNLLYNSIGELFDTSHASSSSLQGVQPSAIYVMDFDGKIYASNVNILGLFHHSTLLAGAPVAAAGGMIVKNGIIQNITNCSGHYRPSSVSFSQIKEALNQMGYTRNFETSTPCSDRDFLFERDNDESKNARL